MTLTADPVESLATVHGAVADRYEYTYNRWLQQQAVVDTLRRDTDVGPGDEADRATALSQLDEQVGIAEALLTQMAELRHAAERDQSGSYGVCESCGDAIPAERLAIFPATTLCVGCKAAARG